MNPQAEKIKEITGWLWLSGVGRYEIYHMSGQRGLAFQTATELTAIEREMGDRVSHFLPPVRGRIPWTRNPPEGPLRRDHGVVINRNLDLRPPEAHPSERRAIPPGVVNHRRKKP